MTPASGAGSGAGSGARSGEIFMSMPMTRCRFSRLTHSVCFVQRACSSSHWRFRRRSLSSTSSRAPQSLVASVHADELSLVTLARASRLTARSGPSIIPVPLRPSSQSWSPTWRKVYGLTILVLCFASAGSRSWRSCQRTPARCRTWSTTWSSEFFVLLQSSRPHNQPSLAVSMWLLPACIVCCLAFLVPPSVCFHGRACFRAFRCFPFSTLHSPTSFLLTFSDSCGRWLSCTQGAIDDGRARRARRLGGTAGQCVALWLLVARRVVSCRVPSLGLLVLNASLRAALQGATAVLCGVPLASILGFHSFALMSVCVQSAIWRGATSCAPWTRYMP